MSEGSCRIFSTCEATQKACPVAEVICSSRCLEDTRASHVCDFISATRQRGSSKDDCSESKSVWQAASAHPVLFPPLSQDLEDEQERGTTCQPSPSFISKSNQHVHKGRSTSLDEQPECDLPFVAEIRARGGTTGNSSSTRSRLFDWTSLPSNENELSWRKSLEIQKIRAMANKTIVQRVADWGPTAGCLVGLHTGAHRQVTYWLRQDVRALCIFGEKNSKVSVYLAAQMESIEELESSTEVLVRQFFLGLCSADMKRGLLITMQIQAHSVPVVHQGHLGRQQARLLILCKDQAYKKDLLAALRALSDEITLHELWTVSTNASGFREIASRREKESASTNASGCREIETRREKEAAKVGSSSISSQTMELLAQTDSA